MFVLFILVFFIPPFKFNVLLLTDLFKKKLRGIVFQKRNAYEIGAEQCFGTNFLLSNVTFVAENKYHFVAEENIKSLWLRINAIFQ